MKMIKLKKFCQKTQSDCGGFTIIEALVSLGIISLVCVVLYAAFATGTKGITGSHRSLSAALKRKRTDAIVRQATGNVEIPFWLKVYEFTATEHTLSLPWSNGVPGVIEVELPEGVTIRECKPAGGTETRPDGLRMTYEVDGVPYSLSAVFASSTLDSGAK